MANRVRNIVLRVPVTAQEREMIELKTQQMGTRCFSVYARIMLIDGYAFILCTDRTNVEAEYALGGLSNNIFASRYTYEEYKETGMIGAYYPESAVLRQLLHADPAVFPDKGTVGRQKDLFFLLSGETGAAGGRGQAPHQIGHAGGWLLQSGTVLAFFGAVLQVVVKPQLFETKRTSQKCEVRFFT